MKQPLSLPRPGRFLYLNIAALAFILSLAPSQATTRALTLTGNLSSATTSSFTADPYRYDQWYLWLQGAPQFYLFQGDVVNATISLDHPYTVTGSTPGTLFDLSLALYDTAYPSITATTVTTLSLANHGTQVYSTTSPITASTSTAAVFVGISRIPFANTSLTFDQITLHSTVSYLGGPGGIAFNISRANLMSELVVPVPEPGSLALLGGGFCGLAVAWCRTVKCNSRAVRRMGQRRFLSTNHT